jgi:hypothetical protein
MLQSEHRTIDQNDVGRQEEDGRNTITSADGAAANVLWKVSWVKWVYVIIKATYVYQIDAVIFL